MRCLMNACPDPIDEGTPPARSIVSGTPSSHGRHRSLSLRAPALENGLREQRGDEIAGNELPMSSTKKQRSASPS
jgi:hypothetical protein